MTRAIFSSSAIRPVLFCSRPAVSISRMSLPLARAFSSASKARPAASPPALVATNCGLGAVGPDPQLLDGGGAEGVAGRQGDLRAFLGQALGQLADGGGLAGAVDPGHQDDEGLLAVRRSASGCWMGASRAAISRASTGLQFGAGDFRVIAVLGHGGGELAWPGPRPCRRGSGPLPVRPRRRRPVSSWSGSSPRPGLGQAGLQPLEESGRRRRFAEGSHAGTPDQLRRRCGR